MLHHKIKLLFVVLIISMLHPCGVLAQEVMKNIEYNQVLKKVSSTEKVFYKTTIVDTLNLPFRDDFSRTKVYPDQTLWMDSDVYINDDYPADPISIGVATFDGIDKYGNPYYPPSSISSKISDYLTSKPINLEEHNNIPYSPADSVYLSFFYQPQGIATDFPQDSDSLMLEFRVPSDSSGWRHIWGVGGTKFKPFKQVMIPIIDSINFKKGFQFRFKNYTSSSGNLDHWNIDYVILDKGRNLNDTSIFEVTWVERTPSSLLKNYEAMPWSHFLFLGDKSTELKQSISIRVRNNSNTSFTTFYRIQVQDEFGAITRYFPGPTSSIKIATTPSANSYSTVTIDSINSPTTIFKNSGNGNGDSALFRIEKIIENSKADKFPYNDTLVNEQKFYNYYAYDDGTAESAYGINAIDAKIAYRFNVLKTDTLRGVYIFFNQMINNASQLTFKLTVWGSNLKATPIYQSADVTPQYENSINGFHFYRIDVPLIISAGEFYVGWQQNTAESLNLGLDMNTTSSDNKFIYVPSNGSWTSSVLPGLWMMRPVFGKAIPVISGIKEINNPTENLFSAYPNPASDRIFIRIKNAALVNSNLIATLSDAMGRLVIRQDNTIDFLDVSAIPNGFYFLKITDKEQKYASSFKIVINK